MTPHPPRPALRSITVAYEDGRPTTVLSGDDLANTLGGCLFWNEFGVAMLEAFYNRNGEHGKAQDARRLWNEGAAFLTKPNCVPSANP